jgi:squalene-hopene/tetraprenyl-beta-curcumene cyclase
MLDGERLCNAYRTVRDELMAELEPSGHWVGRLASSALSTATAASAMAVVLRNRNWPPEKRESVQRQIRAALRWLASHQNDDGGWGDTDKSFSNIATTMLACAALRLGGEGEQYAGVFSRGMAYVDRAGGVEGIRRRYGKDKTFSVPILTNAALAGLVDWREVAPLPYELACLPQAIWGVLHMPVVSYATPALVAIGQANFYHRPPGNPLVRWLRQWAIPRTLAILERMQPASGGFLEATPLTAFVVMSLAGSGRAAHPVAERGLDFLLRSARGDGSWPIDTNLATWTTTLAINALDGAGEASLGLASLDWLLACQHRERHPMTGTAAGGWGWTDLSGAVPDADDTSGALLALAALRRVGTPEQTRRIDQAAIAGLQWLLDLQNSDGGWPTFCRGWGTLPFDRSGVDLTAHALRAIHVWLGEGQDAGRSPTSSRAGVDASVAVRQTSQDRESLAPIASPAFKDRAAKAIRLGMRYLEQQQRPDGSWAPLWFGNQHHPDEENPVYGTARALMAYRDLGKTSTTAARRGFDWLAARCDAAGGWPGRWDSEAAGEASVEETSIAVEALLAAPAGTEAWDRALSRGIQWLIRSVESREHRRAAPIGLYFARLWYYEELYPLLFSVAALGRAVRRWPAPVRGTG